MNTAVARLAAIALLTWLAPGARAAGLFQPRDAVLAGSAGHRYVWRDACGNSMADHQLTGGWEWEGDSREFLALGEGSVRRERRAGLFMLSFPDGAVLRATWPVRFAKGRNWRLRYALTDAALTGTINGLKLTVVATDTAGAKHTVVERTLPRGDDRVYTEQITFDYDVAELTFVHDNLGSECWDVVWLEPEGLAMPRPGQVGDEQLTALGAAIDDLDQTFGRRYPRAAEFRERLARVRADLERLPAEELGQVDRAFAELRREALVANPLVSGQPLLFVVRPQYRSHYHAIDTLFHTGEFNPDRNVPHANLFQGGGALKTIDLASGAVRTLIDVPEGIARDPEVSFDGRRILFALRRNADEDYHLWEMDADGSGLRQLTRAAGVSDFDPVYLPDGDILFSSTRDPKYNQCSRDHGANLYRMAADGANIHQLEHNNLFQNQSTLLPDGRVLYARWEYIDRNFGDAHGLWTMNPDGTNQAIYWGNNSASPAAAYTPRPLPGGRRSLCIFGPHHDHLWGALALIEPARGINGRDAVVRLWPADAARLIHEGPPFDCDAFSSLPIKYADPYPLSDKYFLCSRMTGPGQPMGLYLVDLFGNELLLHAEGPGCYDAMPLLARTRPPVIPDRVDYAKGEGLVYVSDVYRGTHMAGVARGTVKTLRVVEVPPKRTWSRGSWNGQGYTAPGMNWHALEAKRILGTVPVEPDGSAYFRLPADTLVYFQLLDAQGRMVQSMRSATMVAPGERAGCIGCHDERRTTPPAHLAAAVRRPPTALEQWHGPARPYGFMTEVQPVLDRWCVSCHDYGQPAGAKLNLAGDRDFVFNTAYVELWRKGYTAAVGGGPAQIQPARSWGSSVSPLIKAVSGDHHGLRLDAESLGRLATWVDLNAPYYATYDCAYPENWTGRCPLDYGQLDRLQKLTGAEFLPKGSFAAYPGPLVSFERPRLSPLMARLKPDDPRYAEALAIIQAGADQLARRPRADMPGFVPNATDQQREQKAASRWAIELRRREAIGEGLRLYDE